jgi:hypothetical protein
MEKLHRFKDLCRQLLAEGIKPTPTEFAKRGWGYVCGGNVPRVQGYGYWDHDMKQWIPAPDEARQPVPNPGSGATWTSGRYTQARREVLQEAGWSYLNTTRKGNGRWLPPKA